MTKTDDAMKRILDNCKASGKIKARRFIGSSRQDQRVWAEDGLTFGIRGTAYGSCDYAWYSEEEWEDPLTNKLCDRKPLLVVEATDCLNTKSWGNAQIQRFHHALGPFLCNVNSIYFLNPGNEDVSPYLPAAAYFATQHHYSQGGTAAYLVTSELEDICSLVNLLGSRGENSAEFRSKISEILEKMHDYFLGTFSQKPYFSNWTEYLRSREIIKTPEGRYVRDIGGRARNFLDSSVRMGHIFVSEGLTTKYLLIGSGGFDPSKQFFYYLLPLLTQDELSNLDTTLTSDKEWQIVRNDPAFRIVTYDDLEGLGPLEQKLSRFMNPKINLNKTRSEWESTKKELRQGLQSGRITIRRNAGESERITQQSLF